MCVRVRPASQISESSEFSRFSNFRVPEWGCQGGGSALEGAQGGVRKMGASVRFGGVLCGNGPNTGWGCGLLGVRVAAKAMGVSLPPGPLEKPPSEEGDSSKRDSNESTRNYPT